MIHHIIMSSSAVITGCATSGAPVFTQHFAPGTPNTKVSSTSTSVDGGNLSERYSTVCRHKHPSIQKSPYCAHCLYCSKVCICHMPKALAVVLEAHWFAMLVLAKFSHKIKKKAIQYKTIHMRSYHHSCNISYDSAQQGRSLDPS